MTERLQNFLVPMVLGRLALYASFCRANKGVCVRAFDEGRY
jgi:hypothetical protein